MAHTTCFRTRRCLLRVTTDDGWRHLGKMYPKNGRP